MWPAWGTLSINGARVDLFRHPIIPLNHNRETARIISELKEKFLRPNFRSNTVRTPEGRVPAARSLYQIVHQGVESVAYLAGAEGTFEPHLPEIGSQLPSQSHEIGLHGAGLEQVTKPRVRCPFGKRA